MFWFQLSKKLKSCKQIIATYIIVIHIFIPIRSNTIRYKFIEWAQIQFMNDNINLCIIVSMTQWHACWLALSMGSASLCCAAGAAEPHGPNGPQCSSRSGQWTSRSKGTYFSLTQIKAQPTVQSFSNSRQLYLVQIWEAQCNADLARGCYNKVEACWTDPSPSWVHSTLTHPQISSWPPTYLQHTLRPPMLYLCCQAVGQDMALQG